MADSVPDTSTFRINGFGTAGIAQLDAPQSWAYKRDDSEPRNASATRVDLDSRLGLQLNYTPSAQVELVTQFVASRIAPAAVVGDRITLAFVAYRPNPDWTLRIGRVNYDAYLLADHRDVGFAYDFARPPEEFYAQLPTYLNGGDLSREWNASGTLWRVKGLGGSTALTADSFRFGARSLVGIVVSRQDAGLLLRASAIRGRLTGSPPQLYLLTEALEQVAALPVPDVAAEAGTFHSRLGFRNVYTSYFSLGAEYEHGDWLASSEVTRVTGVRGFDAGYGSIGKRFGPVTVFGLFSAIASVEPVASVPDWGTELTPLIGPQAAEQAQILANTAVDALNSSGTRQHTASLGARWNLTSRLAMKAQWDHVRIKADGGRLWDDHSLEAERATIFSILLDFVF